LHSGFERCTGLADNSRIASASPKRKPRAGTENTPTDERLSQLVHVLNQNPTVVLSGTKLAKEIGVSRSAVWRMVQTLRKLGVAIAGLPTSGYSLEKLPDLLLPEILSPMLKGTRIAREVHHYFRIDSTNSAAMRAGADGVPEGRVFIAEEQTAGRGRGGHAWHSEKSAGVYFTVLLRPPLAPADALLLSLMTGLALSLSVEELTGIKPELRWPNDLLLRGKKFCGILCEMSAEPMQVNHAVIGIGMNVNHERFPTALRDLATSLHLETGQRWSRVEVVAALLKSLDREYRVLLGDVTGSGGKARLTDQSRRKLLQRFEERSQYARDMQVQVEEEGGYSGVTAGLDERGYLIVRTAEGLRRVLSGGVRPLKD
jgi:BirA family transcriptional regulator, biotin operon repressor / biotin---[acetyl-CoA-carboxylase] ligase